VRISAGVLLWRPAAAGGEAIEVFLVHPGGPFFAKRDHGTWGIPKGELAGGEDPLAAALRELTEETGFVVDPDAPRLDLTPVRLRSGKIVHAWAVEQDVDADRLVSNTCWVEWPPRSGQRLEIPEVDRGAWFTLEEARDRINPGQLPLLAQLEQLVTAV
jgi:predicted NUDIX family NTP pyrophosphohydrolase